MIRIGYQGLEGSNSEEAAKVMASNLGLMDVKFVPLVSSRNVIGELKRKRIDYGVVATKNSIGGTVGETFEAIKNEYLELVATHLLPIHHCLFKKSGVDNAMINCIASHQQALKQTVDSRKDLYPDACEKEVEDTAIAAKYLAEGKLSERTAIVCRKNAGEIYGLELIKENIEDRSDNITEFRMFKVASIDYSNCEKPSISEKISFQLINEKGVGYISKALIVISIFLSFYVSRYLGMNEWDTSLFVGGYLSFVILLVTSDQLKKKTKYKSLIGYWKYYSFSEKSELVDSSQKIDVPRLVKIQEVDGDIFFSGFICDKENVPLFESTQVILSSLSKSKGKITYWYSNPSELNRGIHLKGIVDLNWVSKHPEAKINSMSGHYFGMSTGDYGQISYLRISKEEYDAHLQNDFI